MTTSGRARKPAGRQPAEADTTQGAAQPPDTAAADDPGGTGPLSGGLSAAPDDVQQLEQEIERTREQLGETVEQLAAKADVKGRARAKAAEVSESVRSQLAAKTAGARQKAMSAGGAGKDQLRGRTAAVVTPVWEAAPEPVQRSVARGASAARQHRVPLAVAAGVVIAGYLAIRWWGKR